MVNLDASDNLGIRWNWYFIASIKLTGRKQMKIKLNAIYLTFRQHVCQLFSIPANQPNNQPTNKKREYRKTHSLSDETEWMVVKQV